MADFRMIIKSYSNKVKWYHEVNPLVFTKGGRDFFAIGQFFFYGNVLKHSMNKKETTLVLQRY